MRRRRRTTPADGGGWIRPRAPTRHPTLVTRASWCAYAMACVTRHPTCSFGIRFSVPSGIRCRHRPRLGVCVHAQVVSAPARVVHNLPEAPTTTRFSVEAQPVRDTTAALHPASIARSLWDQSPFPWDQSPFPRDPLLAGAVATSTDWTPCAHAHRPTRQRQRPRPGLYPPSEGHLRSSHGSASYRRNGASTPTTTFSPASRGMTRTAAI